MEKHKSMPQPVQKGFVLIFFIYIMLIIKRFSADDVHLFER